MSLFQIDNVSYRYPGTPADTKALQELSLKVEPSSLVCLMGPSGSGKTSLLQLMGMVTVPTTGTIIYKGNDVKKLSSKEISRIRLFELGFIFQSFQLFPMLTVIENIEFFLFQQKLETRERRLRSEHALRQVELWEFRNRFPRQLSGGQQQRVGIARAFAKRPQLVLADEPTASLDQKNGIAVMSILKEMKEQNNCTVIFTSHDPVMQKFSEQSILLVDGRRVLGQT